MRSPGPADRLAKRATHERHYRAWSADEDRRLRLLWDEPTLSLAGIAAELGRTELTIYYRARSLGLRCGPPQGFESILQASRRSGFDPTSLRGVLRWAGVRRYPWRARPRGKSPGFNFQYVEIDDVTEAVERWARSEMVDSAARARGICGATLHRLLVADGQRPPRRAKARWRVDSAIIDRVVTAWRRTASVREHALRRGVSPMTLAGKLRRAGVLGPKAPGVKVRLPDAVVDEALRRFPPRRSDIDPRPDRESPLTRA